MNEDDREAGARRMLARIADVLGVPVAQFYEADATIVSATCTDPREIELIRLYRAIRTDEDRQRCLDLIREIASRA